MHVVSLAVGEGASRGCSALGAEGRDERHERRPHAGAQQAQHVGVVRQQRHRHHLTLELYSLPHRPEKAHVWLSLRGPMLFWMGLQGTTSWASTRL